MGPVLIISICAEPGYGGTYQKLSKINYDLSIAAQTARVQTKSSNKTGF
jgi:hypothetical protein